MQIQYDVIYDVGKIHTCDIYSLKNENPFRGRLSPVVILVHGGAWMIGNKSRLSGVAKTLCDNTECVCVVPEYSLSQLDGIFLQNVIICDWVILIILCILIRKRNMQFFVVCIGLFLTIAIIIYLMRRSETRQNAHPAHVNDIAECIKWVCTNKELNIIADTTRITLLGHSAGAHICSLVVLNKRFLNDSIRKNIRGVVCMCGVYSFWLLQKSIMKYAINRGVFAEHAQDLTLQEFGYLQEAHMCKCTLCKRQIKRWEKVIDAWPLFHVKQEENESKTSFLIISSGLDWSLIDHSIEFVKELKLKKWKVQHLHFPRATHFSIRKYWDTQNKHIARAVSDFVLLVSSF